MQITNRYDSSCLWEGEATDMRDAVQKAAKSGADLSRAALSGAALSGANLSGAEIRRIIQIGPIESRDAMLMVWVMEDGSFRYSTGCQIQITEEQFRQLVVASHGGNEHGRAYMEAIEFAHRLAGVYAPKARDAKRDTDHTTKDKD